jgi:hypothetical protein
MNDIGIYIKMIILNCLSFCNIFLIVTIYVQEFIVR